MINKKNIARAFSLIAIAYLFLYININLGSFNFSPNWVCFALILSAIPLISNEEPSVKLLKGFGAFLLGWNVFVWALNIFAPTALGNHGAIQPIISAIPESAIFKYISFFYGIINIYFHFQLLTNLASVAKKCGCGDGDVKRLLNLRTVQTIIATILSFQFVFPLLGRISTDLMYILGIVSATLSICVVIYIDFVLLKLKNAIEKNSQEEATE